MAIYKLGDIVKNITISKKPNYPQIVLNTSDVLFDKLNLKIIEKNIPKHFKKTVRKEEIIFSKIRPTNGRWAWIKQSNNWLLSTDFLILKPWKHILSKYLYVLLTKKINNKIGKIAENRNSCFPRITFKSISNIKLNTFLIKKPKNKLNIPNKKTQQQIIDIIEPLEKLINKLKLIKNKIKILLINQYLQKENKYVNLRKIIFKKTQKRSKQNFYFQTNAVLELNIDFSKIINLNKTNKVPSRANLVPQDNSILFSKLLGENKILPWFNELQNQYVFSTGFYNVQSKNLDHVLSFLLTKDFKEQKIIFANGTTMVGINDNSIKNIKIKKPNENSNVFSKFIFKLIFLENKINLIKNKVLNLLIK